MKNSKLKSARKTAARAFNVKDTVTVVRGPHRGQSTTITEVDGKLCFGYYCGKLISFNMVDAVPYE